MGNRPEWVLTAFAIQYLGATMVAMNTWYTPREMSYVIAHSEMSVLVMADKFLRADYVAHIDAIRPLEESIPGVRKIVVVGSDAAPDMLLFDAFLSRGESMSDAELDALTAAVEPTDIGYLLYTSGSTAHPKGVQLRQGDILQKLFLVGERQGLNSEDCLLLSISLFWGLGCSNALLSAWTHGTHIVLQEHFEAGAALELMERYRCTAFYGTSNIVQAVYDHPDRSFRDISSLRKGLAIGAPEPLRAIMETMMPEMCNCWGLTECIGVSTVTRPTDSISLRSRSVGFPLEDTELSIVDPETGEDLPPHAVGEVRLRALCLTGYFKDPEKTAESFDEQGRFRTGDLGYVDENGYMFYRGRLKEMIRTGAMNVSPAEVEEVLRSHPAVDEAYVIGIPDEARDEVVGAVIVLARGAQATAEELIAHCRKSTASYKVPRHLRIATLDQLPLTATTKVHKARLVELFSVDA
jgi:fatty-acyl-CoA synthase